MGKTKMTNTLNIYYLLFVLLCSLPCDIASKKIDLINNKCDISLKFNPELVSQSSSLGIAYPASNAVDGSDKFTHTQQGVGQWWKAQFAQEYTITKIRIRN